MRVKAAKEKAGTFDARTLVRASVWSYRAPALTFKGPLIVMASFFVFFHQGTNVATSINTQKTVFVNTLREVPLQFVTSQRADFQRHAPPGNCITTERKVK